MTHHICQVQDSDQWPSYTDVLELLAREVIPRVELIASISTFMPGMASALTSTSALAGRASLKNARWARVRPRTRCRPGTRSLSARVVVQARAAQHSSKLGKHVLGRAPTSLPPTSCPAEHDRCAPETQQQVAKPNGVRGNGRSVRPARALSAHGAYVGRHAAVRLSSSSPLIVPHCASGDCVVRRALPQGLPGAWLLAVRSVPQRAAAEHYVSSSYGIAPNR